ncbi:creatininase family protein [Natronoglomus mannanivorans]|uniref:Creatininase family protein n=1 Tax=Natronoglomus mannanivorans TaxID=2979990 RepID=A0AAP3E2C2_9EURY|nr:creatininase family protein [Halobacteria archaeon AArc-xg1-1]
MDLETNCWTAVDELNPTIALLPVGSTEQHGPHAPVGTDTTIAREIAAEADRNTAPESLVLPAVPVGVAPYHATFPGTLTVTAETLRRYVREIVCSLTDSSIETVILVNGHGGNGQTLAEIARTCTQTTSLDVYSWEWMRALEDDVGHAGELETSLLLALCPETVGEPAAGDATAWNDTVDGGVVHHFTDGFSENGAVGDATDSSARQGADVFETVTGALVSFLERVGSKSSSR